MAKTIITAFDEQFKAECKVIDLKYEYSGYTGTERFAVITELTEKQILEKYPEQIKPYIPFIVLSPAFGEVREEYRRNEKKHEMRAVRNGHIFGFDDETEIIHPELIGCILEDEFLLSEQYSALHKAISKLKPMQRQRVFKRFFDGKSSRVIAEEEGVAYSAVDSSINTALKNLRKFLMN